MEINQTVYGNSSIDSLLVGHTKEPEEEKDPLGRESFLTMLVAQLQHQDPLNPLDGTDFTAQLAQFSVLEQQFTTNDNLEAILGALGTQKEDNLIDYIGKEVRGQANAMVMQDGVASNGYFELKKQGDAAVFIYNSEGHEIGSVYKGQKNAGYHAVGWDGKDHEGNLAPDGTYTFEVMALDALGGYVPVSTMVTGKVTGVTYERGAPFLQVDGRLLDPSTVISVWQGEEDDSGSSTDEEDTETSG